jgi:hypothetical protein
VEYHKQLKTTDTSEIQNADDTTRKKIICRKKRVKIYGIVLLDTFCTAQLKQGWISQGKTHNKNR